MTTFKRNAEAIWNGDGLTGKGTLTTQSGALKGQPYSFKTRFESEDGKAGTNPEELIAAAHAGCFTMALSFGLKAAGFVANELHTQATVEMEKIGSGFVFKAIELHLRAKISGVTDVQFQDLAVAAKLGCPVSKALASVPITLRAQLM